MSLSSLPHELNGRLSKAGWSLYHSVMSCLRGMGPSCHTSLGACSCSLSNSCSTVVHLFVGSTLGRLGVKSHITCVMKNRWTEVTERVTEWVSVWSKDRRAPCRLLLVERNLNRKLTNLDL